VVLSGSTMTWTMVGTILRDIDGDGIDEDAFGRIKWRRR
jgi:hypothetical protein